MFFRFILSQNLLITEAVKQICISAKIAAHVLYAVEIYFNCKMKKCIKIVNSSKNYLIQPHFIQVNKVLQWNNNKQLRGGFAKMFLMTLHKGHSSHVKNMNNYVAPWKGSAVGQVGWNEIETRSNEFEPAKINTAVCGSFVWNSPAPSSISQYTDLAVRKIV